MNQQQILALCTQRGLDSVMIDVDGVSTSASRVLVACVHVESGFDQYALNLNKLSDGSVASIDYGICQINSYWNIGMNKPFPSPEYVLSNPTACISWMITQFKAGNQHLWSSFVNGEFKKYLPA